jgi:hypothetical protein
VSLKLPVRPGRSRGPRTACCVWPGPARPQR